jgi:hypothetical protein
VHFTRSDLGRPVTDGVDVKVGMKFSARIEGEKAAMQKQSKVATQGINDSAVDMRVTPSLLRFSSRGF